MVNKPDVKSNEEEKITNGDVSPSSVHGSLDSNHGGCEHSIKSSSMNRKGHVCCFHSKLKAQKINVACQTDPEVYYFTGSAASQIPETSSPKPSSLQVTPRKDDGSRSEGTLRLMINNFRNMNSTIRGPPKVVSEVPWKIMVMPRQHVVAKKGTQKCLGFFLQCCPESYSDSWSCQAAAELRLISQKPGIPNFIRKTNHVYTAKENDWGYSCFMTWADILDESQGYMKDEKVILEVYVKAELPKGILTHDAFCKKIQDYTRLSEMQSSRGLIDKALEVNASALKFCKDKDTNIKAELEAQKAKLIEMKLKQSIERIEKGSKGEGENPNCTSQTLKQAAASVAKLKNSAVTAGSVNKSKGKGVSSPQKVATAGHKTSASLDSSGSLNSDEKSDELKGDVADDTLPTDENVHNDGVEEILTSLVNKVAISGDDGDLDAELSEDEDSEYENEICDSCLVEKLEHMRATAHEGVAEDSPALQVVDFASQTDFPDDSVFATPLNPALPTVTATPPVSPPKKIAERKVTNKSKSADSTPNSKKAVSKLGVHPLPIGGQDDLVPPPPPPPPPVANLETQFQAALTASGNVDLTSAGTGVPLAGQALQKLRDSLKAGDNDQLLKLITEESKASLNNIKDTLERLVSLAAGGNGDVDKAMDATAAALLMASAEHGLKLPPPVKTDVIEIPPIELPLPPDHKFDDAPALATMPDVKAIPPRSAAPRLNNTAPVVTPVAGGRSKQQTVQTELTYPPRTPSPVYTDEEYQLLQQAKEMVEGRQDELNARFGQLLDQSEANRLADTVKKVEKRMKDIEKQTMTCRKELSDECERHYKEEQKLIKANKQLKQQLDATNEKFEKLNLQLKEKRNEIKKLEKKVKTDSQASAENLEMSQKIELLEREHKDGLKKTNDELKGVKRDLQKAMHERDHLQEELSGAQAEIDRLTSQLEDRATSVKRMETTLKSEKQQAQQSLRDAVERAKKAEVNLLEFKLEMGLTMCTRALKECEAHIGYAEEICKRLAQAEHPESMKQWSIHLDEWHKNREKLKQTVLKAKTDFGQQIELVKSGKTLASLPLLEAPTPPSPPQPPKFSTPPPSHIFEQKRLAPIGVNPAASMRLPHQTPMPGPGQPPPLPHLSGGAATNGFIPPPGAVNGPAGGVYQPFGAPYEPTQPPPPLVHLPQQQQQQQQQQSAQHHQFSPETALQQPQWSTVSMDAVSVGAYGVLNAANSAVGFSPWEDTFKDLRQHFMGGSGGSSNRQQQPAQQPQPGGPFAARPENGTPVQPTSSSTATTYQTGVSRQTTASPGSATTQWSNWAPLVPGSSSTSSSVGGRMTATSPTAALYGFGGGQTGNMQGAQNGSRTSSPTLAVQSDRNKRNDVCIQQLQCTFPNLSVEALREYINEYRNLQPGKTVKGQTVEQVIQGVTAVILSKQQLSADVPRLGGNDLLSLDSFSTISSPRSGPTLDNQLEQQCGMCGEKLTHTGSKLSDVCTLSCRHQVHSRCAQMYMGSGGPCPLCAAGAYCPPLNDFPELGGGGVGSGVKPAF